MYILIQKKENLYNIKSCHPYKTNKQKLYSYSYLRITMSKPAHTVQPDNLACSISIVI